MKYQLNESNLHNYTLDEIFQFAHSGLLEFNGVDVSMLINWMEGIVQEQIDESIDNYECDCDCEDVDEYRYVIDKAIKILESV